VSAEDRSKWDARYREGGRPGEPSPYLRSLDAALPRTGRALDVAGGDGRNALWLARRGLAVTIADVSAVGLERARARAEADGLTIETVCVDLETEPLPPGPWDLVVCILYLQRSLFPVFASVLAPGGLLAFLQPTARNLERHPKPPRAFLLGDGEIATLLPADLEVVSLTEGWTEDGHHEARLLARRA
jgi:SAM-dependent methyltransferase